MGERWQVIELFPDYSISEYGRVWSRVSNKELRPGLSSTGYLTVALRTESNKPVSMTVHSLLAEAFIGSTVGLQVNHIDGNKLNNALDNLEIVTHQENLAHARRSPHMVSPGRPKRAVRIVETGDEFDSITMCADYIGGSKANITACLKGRLKTHKGYTFEFIE